MVVSILFSILPIQPQTKAKAWESWVPSYLQQRFEQAKQSEGGMETLKAFQSSRVLYAFVGEIYIYIKKYKNVYSIYVYTGLSIHTPT